MEPNNQFQNMNTQMNNGPVGATNPASTPFENKKKVGPIVVVLAVVLVLVIGALYFFASSINKDTVPSDEGIPQETVQPVTNTSDDVQAIDADLNAAIEGVDAQTF